MLDASDYLASLQCMRRVWLSAHRPERAESRSEALLERLRASEALAREARALFPDAREIGGVDPVAATRGALADPETTAVLGATFEAAGARARVAVLEREGEREWGLRCVKSAQRLRDEHLDEVAFQLAVVQQAAREQGWDPGTVVVLHPDPDYRRGEAGIDWARYFRRSDVTRDVVFLAEDVADQLQQAQATLALAEEPHVEPSPHCKRPWTCGFLASCTRAAPPDWVGWLPGLRPQTFHALHEAGAERLDQIPAEFPLSRAQRNARDAVLRGGPVAGPSLVRDVERLGPPTDYLDFEAVAPEVPIFAGTRPYQVLAFQWSLHRAARANPDAPLEHRSFLARGDEDPRRGFAAALCEALAEGDAPILVYSPFEATVLEELADALPDLSASLQRIRARLRDLLPIVRNGLYVPEFRGSFSLKRVAPAVGKDFAYEDLEGIRDGGAAASAYLRILRQQATAEEAERIRAQLLDYCAHDTLALVTLHRALRAHVDAA